MKHNLSTNFVPYNDADFLAFARGVVFSMQNNPHFPDPVPPLETISELTDEFNNSLVDASMKNKVDIAEKNTLRKKLEHQLGRLALYVMYVADDDESILISSGYHLTKKRMENKLEEPQQPSLTSGVNSGEIISTIRAVKGAKYYLHEIIRDEITADSVWESHTCSRRKYTFENLVPGQKYWVRIIACGTGKQKRISTPAYQWAQ